MLGNSHKLVHYVALVDHYYYTVVLIMMNILGSYWIDLLDHLSLMNAYCVVDYVGFGLYVAGIDYQLIDEVNLIQSYAKGYDASFGAVEFEADKPSNHSKKTYFDYDLILLHFVLSES
mmetsp:Transcript_29309/g.32556  ORF Transcript_29309/g.32556 Transcript_29309/m.32556 type:complete len:118 (-) Transcript_29309:38-391(-)